MVLSVFGLGTSTVSQVQAMRMQQQQAAQQQAAQAQIYQHCPIGSQPQVQQLPDGSYRVQCVDTGSIR
jgi:Tfp pilus assembly protein PilV